MRVAYQNFTGGEVAPTLSARYDLARYRTSLSCMENMLPNLHGDAERRPGMYYLGELDGDALLLPFIFNADSAHNFVLVFGDHTLRIADRGGLIPLEVGEDNAGRQCGSSGGTAPGPAMSTPYAIDDLPRLSHAQMGDVVYLAHSGYPLHKITRSGSAGAYVWRIAAVELNTSLAAPGTPSVTFSGSGNGYALRYKLLAVDANGKESLPSEAGACANGRHPSDWVQGNYVSLSWTAVEGAAEYNIYREEAGYFGFIGISAGTSFSDQNYEADIADTPREDWNPFADGNTPAVVAFHQQRMVLAGTRNSPQAFYMSRTGDFENFRKSRPLQDDDPIEYMLASGSIDGIVWAASFGDLLLGTSGGEYKASGDGGVITTSNVQITAQSCWGSTGLAPILIGNSILHVQRHGSRVRDLYYSLEKDGYAGNDLSIMAPHLFAGHSLRQWAFQQTPGSVIWAVRDDGLLLALTYMKEHDIWGWSRHITDGAVRSVAAISGDDADELLLVVRRTVAGRERHFLERLAPRWQDAPAEDVPDIARAFFVDAGLTFIRETPSTQVEGLEHLEGRPVAILADGAPVEGLSVHGGRLSLPYPARIVTVGLPYVSALSPLPVEADSEAGSTLGMRRAYGQCTVRLHCTVGGKYGTARDELYDFPTVPEQWGEPCVPFSGDLECIPGGGQRQDTTFWIVQDRPLPLQVAGIVVQTDFGQLG